MSLRLPFKNINEFSLHEIIQDGPYTVILRGYQKNLKRSVLVKLLKPHSSQELKDRFKREAHVYAKLSHPNIVSVYALGEMQNYLYIILEYIDGCSLKTLLDNTGIPQTIIWDIGHAILDALKHAEGKKVVHRDIKPANIMIDREGKVKVSDFGLALISDEPNITRQQTLIGTPAYMSPEQITGGTADARSDIFSFGSLLYEMIYREQAFGHDSFSASINSILNDTPPRLGTKDTIAAELKTFLEKCLQKEKEERWASIDQVLKAWEKLKSILKAQTTAINLTSLVADFSAEIKKNRAESKIFITRISRPKKWFITALFVLVVLFIIFLGQDRDIPGQEHTFTDSLQQKTDNVFPQTNRPQLVINEYTENKPAKGTNQGKEIISSEKNKKTNDTLALNIAHLQPALLNLEIIPWAKVYLNDSLIDSHFVKQDISLKANSYTLRMEHPRFPVETQIFSLKAGEKTNIYWSFWEKTGFLDIQVRPWADVYINDEYLDTTPFGKPLQLPAGTLILELRHPALKGYREIITILANDTLVIKKNLNTGNGIIFE